jgi:hypothetical protein
MVRTRRHRRFMPLQKKLPSSLLSRPSMLKTTAAIAQRAVELMKVRCRKQLSNLCKTNRFYMHILPLTFDVSTQKSRLAP